MNTLPAGTYVISDPCYVLSDEDYDRALEETDYFSYDTDGGVFLDSVHNRKWACLSTMYGDGAYYDNYGHEYGVDAGCIACIPIEMVDPKVQLSGAKSSHIFRFSTDFNVIYDQGKLYFGHVVINTADSDDDYVDDAEDGWDEE